MKIFALFLLIVCSASAQVVNKIVTDERSNKPMLIGECSREAFQDSGFAWWFDSGYMNYEPEKGIIDKIKESNLDIRIEIVLGTWCSDSRREIPRFFVILDIIEFPDTSLKLIAVNRDKIDPETDIAQLEIEYVPTFIFYREGEEIGRIIETPEVSLEEDFLNIIR
jgi:hypothetical protein